MNRIHRAYFLMGVNASFLLVNLALAARFESGWAVAGAGFSALALFLGILSVRAVA